jgi:hypothetical protein
MKALPNWSRVNQEFYRLRDAVKAQDFVRI